MIAAVLAFLASVVAVLTYLQEFPPNLEANVLVELDQRDPFSALFVVENKSTFQLSDVTSGCFTIEAKYPRGGLQKGNLVTPPETPIDLPPGQRITKPCSSILESPEPPLEAAIMLIERRGSSVS